MRSRRFIGKKIVGRPMRSPSGSLIWRMKWSNELRSTPRTVIPDGLIARSSPQIFSLGECKLTTTIECRSMRSDDGNSNTGYRISASNGAKSIHHGSLGLFLERQTEDPCPRMSRRLLRQLVVEMQKHHHETCQNNSARQPAKRMRSLPLARIHGLAIGVNFAEDKSARKACDVRGVVDAETAPIPDDKQDNYGSD